MAAVSRLRDPDLENDPARLPQVSEHVNAVVKGDVRRDRLTFRLEHDGRLCRGDPPQQPELLIGQRAAGRIIPELKAPAADFTDSIGEPEPGPPRQGIRPDGGRMYVEDRHPFARDTGVLATGACPADDSEGT